MAVAVGACEHDCDLGEAAVETVLSALELPPFRLLTVEGTHLDCLRGQFRCSGPVLSALLRAGDPIVLALHALDAQLAPRDKERQRAGLASVPSTSSTLSGAASLGGVSGLGSAVSYGFGQGGASAGREEQGEGAAAYGRQPFGPLSLLAVAGVAGLTREEAARGLHSLQSRGVLEYGLSEPALYVTVHTEGEAGEGYLWDAEHYAASLWRLALAATAAINGIAQQASDRALDMWRLGLVVAGQGQGGGQGEGARQEALSSLLCHLLEHGGAEGVKMDVAAEGCSAGSDNETDDEGRMRALLAAFQAAPPPVAGLAQEAEEGTEAAMPDAFLLQARKERQRLLADAASLRADPRFSDLLRSLAQALPPALLQAPALAAALPPARRRLAALYTAKVRSYPSTAPSLSSSLLLTHFLCDPAGASRARVPAPPGAGVAAERRVGPTQGGALRERSGRRRGAPGAGSGVVRALGLLWIASHLRKLIGKNTVRNLTSSSTVLFQGRETNRDINSS